MNIVENVEEGLAGRFDLSTSGREPGGFRANQVITSCVLTGND